MAKKSEIQIIISAVDKASKEIGGVGNALDKLGKVGLIAGAAVVGVVTGLGVAAFSLAKDAAKVERTRKTWDNLAKSLGETGGDIESLREATRGMVNDADLMYSSSKLMSMGLAGSNAEAAHLLEISTQLGSAMGVDATQAAEDFALMLANQSIPRLDTFGISSGVVRQRIEEMMAADQNLTREQAFLNATLEQAEITLGKVGEQGVGAAADMDRLKANVDNLKSQIGEKFLPVLATVSEKLVEAWNKPEVQAFINDKLLPAIDGIVGDENSGIVGVITKLAEGDIAGAFDTAFGEGTWQKIQTFITNFEKGMDGIKKAIDAVKIAIDGVKTAWGKLKESGWIPGIIGQEAANSQIGRWGWNPPKAGGGLVSAGTTYKVGENGMEYFTPRVSGTITPESRMNGSGMGLSLTVNINSAVNLADRAYAERELMPYIEAGVRQLLARAA